MLAVARIVNAGQNALPKTSPGNQQLAGDFEPLGVFSN